MEKEIKQKIAPFTDVPILFISVTEKLRIMQAIEKAIEVHNNRNQQIKTNVLNDLLLPIIESMPPPSINGRLAKIKYVTQLPTRYPTFAFFVNNPKYVKDNYKQFLENQLRKHFNFTGVTIDVFFREK
jgi:GTP-binding protein